MNKIVGQPFLVVVPLRTFSAGRNARPTKLSRVRGDSGELLQQVSTDKTRFPDDCIHRSGLIDQVSLALGPREQSAPFGPPAFMLRLNKPNYHIYG